MPQFDPTKELSTIASTQGKAFADAVAIQLLIMDDAPEDYWTGADHDSRLFREIHIGACAKLLEQLTGFRAGLIRAEATRIANAHREALDAAR